MNLYEDTLQAEEALGRSKSLDLKQVDVEISIAATDLFEYMFLPKLASIIQAEAPGINLRCQNAQSELPKERMESGEYDVAIAAFPTQPPDGYFQQKLYDEHYVGVARKGHPHLKRVTLKKFIKTPHIMLAPNGVPYNEVDITLAEKQLHRRIAITVSNLLTPGRIVSETDYLLVAPARLARIYVESHPLEVFKLPFDQPSFTIKQIWHRRVHLDPVNQWFRAQMYELCKDY